MPEQHTSIIASGFQRVTRRQPCLICAKPDWCSRTADGRFSICMRIRDGAVKINQQGGAIFLHPAAALHTEPPLDCSPAVPLVSVQARDFVYRHLLRLSPARRYQQQLIGGAKGLSARGLRAVHWRAYGGLPPQASERDSLAQAVLRLARSQFPALDDLCGVPGFWKDERVTHLGQPYHHGHPCLLIPVRDGAGFIQACQLRRAEGGARAKYRWLSSAGFPNGVGSGSPLHFTFRQEALPKGARITVVEGLLKADVLAALRPDLSVIGMGGVSASHGAVIEATRERPVVVGFDQDYRRNEQVCRHLAALLAARVTSEGREETTRIALWPPRVKGIDDAVLLGLPITTVRIADWWRQLSPALQDLVQTLWHEQGMPSLVPP